MIDSFGTVRQQAVVDLEPAQAFELFTTHMTDWWPAEHHIGAAPIEELVVEPRTGGRWYTRHTDGSETSTGSVRVWDPPGRLVLTWQITAEWSFDTALITTVTVTFTPDGERTLVEIAHGDLDNYGPDTDKMRELFDTPDAWQGILVRYAASAAVFV